MKVELPNKDGVVVKVDLNGSTLINNRTIEDKDNNAYLL